MSTRLAWCCTTRSVRRRARDRWEVGRSRRAWSILPRRYPVCEKRSWRPVRSTVRLDSVLARSCREQRQVGGTRSPPEHSAAPAYGLYRSTAIRSKTRWPRDAALIRVPSASTAYTPGPETGHFAGKAARCVPVSFAWPAPTVACRWSPEPGAGLGGGSSVWRYPTSRTGGRPREPSAGNGVGGGHRRGPDARRGDASPSAATDRNPIRDGRVDGRRSAALFPGVLMR